ERLLEPRLPLRHFDRPALERGFGIGVAGDAGLAARARLPEQVGADLDALGGRIDERIERLAILDRLGALLRVVERILEGRRRLQTLEERHYVPDLGLVVIAVLAPWRHHGLRIVDPRVEDVVEQPLIGATGLADLRQIGPDIAR